MINIHFRTSGLIVKKRSWQISDIFGIANLTPLMHLLLDNYKNRAIKKKNGFHKQISK